MTYYKWRLTYRNHAGPWCERRFPLRNAAFQSAYLNMIGGREEVCSIVVKKFEEEPEPVIAPFVEEFEDFDEFDKY